MPTWGELSNSERRRAVRMFQAGDSYAALCKEFDVPESNRNTFCRRLRSGAMWLSLFDGEKSEVNGLDLETLADSIRNKSKTLRQLSQEFDRSEDTIRQGLDALRERNFNIIERRDLAMLDTQTVQRVQPLQLNHLEGREICFAVSTDIHAGSTGQQITAVREFERIAVQEYGAQVIFHTGDIMAGYKVYRGQEHDLYAHSADEQMAAADKTLVAYERVQRLVLGGNHDFSFIKAGGFDAVKALCRRRADMTYCGYDAADVQLTENAVVRLWHPRGGVPYAVSYRLQKGIEALAFDELERAVMDHQVPNLRVVLAGHLHIECELQRGPILAMQCGAFEGQTNYLRAKGLFPQVGGYVVWLTLTKSGLIQRKRFEFVHFQDIENDWQNWPELWQKQTTPSQSEPLFSWEAL
jgi:hypothetical protein